MARQSAVTWSGHTILVLDHRREILSTVRGLLEREGHRVVTADTLAQALTTLQQLEIDLCLVPHSTPNRTLARVVRDIREIDGRVRIVVQASPDEQLQPDVFEGLEVHGFHDMTDGPERLLACIDMALKRYLDSRISPGESRRLGHSPKVLLIGQQGPLTWLAGRLASAGCAVLEAPNCGAGLDVFVGERTQAVVIGDDMVQDGVSDLVRRLRALDSIVPVIVLTAGLQTEERARLRIALAAYRVQFSADADDHVLAVVRDALGMPATESVASEQDVRDLVLAKFCHDVRNLIHVVHGYAELLHDELTGSRADGIADRLSHAAEAALGLVQQYLDLVRLGAPGVVVRRERVDIPLLLSELRTLSDRAIGERPIELVISVSMLGAIYTDTDKLRAILGELLTTALKFSSEGQVHFDVLAGPDGAEFVVRDTARHIDGDDLSVLLEPLRQWADNGSSSTPGQGLGLAIAMRLGAVLGGHLTVGRAAQGAGTVFTLRLPAAIHQMETSGQLLH